MEYLTIIWLLGGMSVAVTIGTNLTRRAFKSLQGSKAKERLGRIYWLTIIWGFAVAAALRANIFEILKNPQGPALYFDWDIHGDDSSGSQWLGIVVTGFVLAFISKFWNDIFDMIYEAKRWIRLRNDAFAEQKNLEEHKP